MHEEASLVHLATPTKLSSADDDTTRTSSLCEIHVMLCRYIKRKVEIISACFVSKSLLSVLFLWRQICYFLCWRATFLTFRKKTYWKQWPEVFRLSGTVDQWISSLRVSWELDTFVMIRSFPHHSNDATCCLHVVKGQVNSTAKAVFWLYNLLIFIGIPSVSENFKRKVFLPSHASPTGKLFAHMT